MSESIALRPAGPPKHIAFMDDQGREVGRLHLAVPMRFEGQAEKSAGVLLRHLMDLLEPWLQAPDIFLKAHADQRGNITRDPLQEPPRPCPLCADPDFHTPDRLSTHLAVDHRALGPVARALARRIFSEPPK